MKDGDVKQLCLGWELLGVGESEWRRMEGEYDGRK
jgi:hypothetical protein